MKKSVDNTSRYSKIKERELETHASVTGLIAFMERMLEFYSDMTIQFIDILHVLALE